MAAVRCGTAAARVACGWGCCASRSVGARRRERIHTADARGGRQDAQACRSLHTERLTSTRHNIQTQSLHHRRAQRASPWTMAARREAANPTAIRFSRRCTASFARATPALSATCEAHCHHHHHHTEHQNRCHYHHRLLRLLCRCASPWTMAARLADVHPIATLPSNPCTARSAPVAPAPFAI